MTFRHLFLFMGHCGRIPNSGGPVCGARYRYQQHRRTSVYSVVMSHCRISACLLLALLAICRAGDLDFVKENIFVSIHAPDTMRVRGEYFFVCKNGHPLETTVQYPFPIDSDMAAPRSIRVELKTGTLAFDTLPGLSSILFRVSIAQGDTAKITISYYQLMKHRTGRYILTTTQTWGKPLVNSTYYLTAPSSVRVSFLSYESDSVYAKKDSLVYYFAKKVFMPDRDFVFSYEKR
jgi:hypothetical protein